MKNRGRATAVIVVLIAVAAAAGPALRAQAAQRSMYVSVLDRSGAPVPGLGPSDFIVREDRVAREVLSVESARDPMQIALLVDNSQAAEAFIRDYREALPAFVAAMIDPDSPRNQIALIALAERPTILSDYTSDAAQLQKGIGRVFAMSGSGTYLLDGIIETSRGITRRGSTRPVIVAITSEGMELSDRQYQQVLEPLKESGAAFHVIVVGSPRNNDQDRSVVLDQGTRDSGGRYDTILASTALTGKMKEVARELKSQYRVTYARPQTLIPPEQITVAAAKPGLTARGTPARDDREVRRP
jgi:VWFA-related protein